MRLERMRLLRVRLTKYNSETSQYEYIEKAKTQEQFIDQRKTAIQKLGLYEDMIERGALVYVPTKSPCEGAKSMEFPKFEYKEQADEQR